MIFRYTFFCIRNFLYYYLSVCEKQCANYCLCAYNLSFFATFSLSLSIAIFHFQHIISGLFQEKEDYRPRSTGLGSSGGAGGRRKHSFDDGNNIERGREGDGGPKPPRDWKCLEVNCNISYDVFRLVYVFLCVLMLH